MVTILVVGLIAWALTGAVEDTIRSARGDAPRSERRGLRGYLDDRFQALADHHHAVADSGMLTAWDARQARKHLARTKALKLAGFATDEEVARAKEEHKRRLGFIAKGIDPDTMPPLFPVRGQVWEPVEKAPPVLSAEDEEDPEPLAETAPTESGVSIDDHFYTSAEVWINPEYFPPEPDTTEIEPDPVPEDKPWSPFESTDTKENNTMPNNGEITGPAAVKQFHDDFQSSVATTVTITDTLDGLAADLEARAKEVDANIGSTETAAAGMTGLGMADAAGAAAALMETQQTIQAALAKAAAAVKESAAILTDQILTTHQHLAVIKTAYDAQVRMQDERAGAGLGNLATDTYLDNND